MNFEFATAGRIVFGAGVSRDVGRIASGYGKRCFWVHGKQIRRSQDLINQLKAQGITVATFAIEGEPTVERVSLGARECLLAKAQFVVGYGGGSVMDAAKAISALSTNPGDPSLYLEVIGKGMPLTETPLPIFAIPTTSGTGAEVTRNAVLHSTEHQLKVSLRHPSMLPHLALVDPELTISLSKDVTAATGLDALTQLIEAFLCSKSNAMTDLFCREGMARSAKSLRCAFGRPKDLTAREDLSLASLLSGLALSNAGLGAVHGFAGPIGGQFGGPHGAICAALLPSALEVNYRALKSRDSRSPTLERFREVACILTGLESADVLDGIRWIQLLTKEFGIPLLREYGVREADIPLLCEKARKTSSMKANPIELTTEELHELLHRAV